MRRLLGRRRRPGPLAVEAPAAILELAREGVVPLDRRRTPGDALEIAAVVPGFRRGSGGHATIMHLLRGLEARGHRCSVWLDGAGRAADFSTWFGAPAGGVHEGLAGWRGADVALATGWQTAHRVARLPGCAARAYLVQDHEPEFFGASAERTWAQQTYRLGFGCVAASPWLAALLRERYGASAWSFDLGVDHAVYAPRPEIARSPQTVVAYARVATPRRALPLALLALEQLAAQRPDVEVVLFGEPRELEVRFAARQAGVLDGPALAELYARATVGLVVSMTNPSLVPTEMMACGLPVVDVAGEAMLASFGAEGPIELAPCDPLGLAAAVERLLGDAALREARGAAGLTFVAPRTWAGAARQVEAALREIVAAPGP